MFPPRNIRSYAYSLFVVLLLASSIVPGSAAVSVGLSSVKITAEGTVDAHMEVVLVQNITSRLPDFRLPIINVNLDETNASEAISLITEALRSKSPGVQPQSVRIHISTTQWDPLDAEQSIRILLDFQLQGASETAANLRLVDTAWRSLVVEEEITVQNISLNQVGESYLTTAFQQIRDIDRPVTVGIIFYLEGQITSPVSFLSAVPSVTLLDFSGLRDPVDAWDSTFDFSTVSTEWSRSAENYKLIVEETETLPTGEKTTAFYGVRSLARMEVQAPGLIQATGDMIGVDAGQGVAESLMTGIVVALLASMTAAFFIERRVTIRKFVKKRPR